MRNHHDEGRTSKRNGRIAVIVLAFLTVLTIWGSTPLYKALTGIGRPISEVPIYNAGTYTALARGYGGDVSVTLKVSEVEIEDVKIEGKEETPDIGGKAISQLPNIIWKKQSSDFDSVSGATVTSNAVKKAMNKAIGQAAKEGTYLAEQEEEADELEESLSRLPEIEEILQDIPDGMYFYRDQHYDESGFKNYMEVRVENQKIVEIRWDAVNDENIGKRQLSMEGSYVMSENGPLWYQQAEQLEDYILETQSTEGLADEEGYADSISSVSINISGFLNALKNCLIERNFETC